MLRLPHFPLLSTRKQLFILRLLLPIFFLVITLMLIWSKSGIRVAGGIKKRIRYEGRQSINTSELIRLRRKVIGGNIDEFFMIVHKEIPFHEINLRARSLNRREYYDEGIEADEKRVIPGLGENGGKAFVPKKYEARANKSIEKESYNQVLNEMISVKRSVPDAREPACRTINYDLDDLPTMSIIIVFKNEPYISLARMLHGIFNRTPPNILLEIILVDDFSSNRDLLGLLERYLATRLPAEKLRLLRLHTNAGLIRARMIGAHLAVGDVLVFLDAHCEVNEQWAEPLLQRIKEERTTVVSPIIDIIHETTMEYQYGWNYEFLIGGFKWSGHFTWIPIPERENKRKQAHHLPTRTPTMAGGLFAIDRKFFWKMGSYDPRMRVWGGENLEMSFRIWQCGGTIEVIPCSRVGHLFRSIRPYKFTAEDKIHNSARLAEVWMDSYKELFMKNQYFRPRNIGDTSLRKAFRKRNKCHNFQWYLDNVYPEKFKLERDSKFYGQVRNPHSNYCIDYWGPSEENYTLSVYNCSTNYYLSQEHFLSKTGHLRKEMSCARVESDNSIRMAWCPEAIYKDNWFNWEYNGKSQQLTNKETRTCLTLVPSNLKGSQDKFSLRMERCKKNAKNQKWEFRPGRSN